MKQKHFIGIQAIREEDTELRERNTKGNGLGVNINSKNIGG